MCPSLCPWPSGARLSRRKGGICRGLALKAQEGRKVSLAVWLLDSSFYGKWSPWPHEFRLCTAAEGGQAGTRMSLLPLNNHAPPPSMGQRLGSRWRRSIRNHRLISKGVFFLGVHRRGLNVLCECSNICFGFLWVNRLKETVHYAAVKRVAFLKHFIILAECKEGRFTHKRVNTYFVRSLRIL